MTSSAARTNRIDDAEATPSGESEGLGVQRPWAARHAQYVGWMAADYLVAIGGLLLIAALRLSPEACAKRWDWRTSRHRLPRRGPAPPPGVTTCGWRAGHGTGADTREDMR
jgi:hypothetical protein